MILALLLAASVRIGIINSVTGPEAPIGETLSNGYKLALEDLKKAGIEVEVVSEDDTGKPQIALSALEKLVTRDKVTGIVGPYSSSSANPTVFGQPVTFTATITLAGGANQLLATNSTGYVSFKDGSSTLAVSPLPILDEPQSNATPRTRFESLRHAGDLQLERKGDLQAAVRFYKRALDIASQDELAVSIDHDNWL